MKADPNGAHIDSVASNQAREEQTRQVQRAATHEHDGGGLIGLLDELQESVGNRAVGQLLRQYGVQRAPQRPQTRDASSARSHPHRHEDDTEDAPHATAGASPTPLVTAALATAGLHDRAPSTWADGADALHGSSVVTETSGRADTPIPAQRDGVGSTGIVQAAEIGLEGGPVGPELAGRINAKRGGGAPLDVPTRHGMERAFGASFADVGVHTDMEADALNRQVSAVAFTTGRDIFFRQGAYQPHSAANQKLLAHELTHVVQQRGLSHGGPMAVGPAGDSHEQEADAVGQRIVETLQNE